MTPLWEASTTVVAQAGGFGTNGIQRWILDNVFPLLLMCLGLLFLFLGGGKGDNSAIMKRLGGAFACLAVIGIAVTGAGVDMSTFIAGLFHS